MPSPTYRHHRPCSAPRRDDIYPHFWNVIEGEVYNIQSGDRVLMEPLAPPSQKGDEDLGPQSLALFSRDRLVAKFIGEFCGCFRGCLGDKVRSECCYSGDS